MWSSIKIEQTGCSLLVVVALYTVVGQVIKTSERCFNTSHPPVHLTCDIHQSIHVISVRYQKTTKNCESKQCQVLHLSRADGLSTTCNGLSDCWEPIEDYWITDKCGRLAFFKISISYECISDYAMIDVCNTTTAMSETGQLYLASPNYFNPVLAGPDRPCFCDVTGEDLTVEILELYFRAADGLRGNLTMASDQSVWTSGHHSPIDYNNVVLKDANGVKVTLDTHMTYGQIAWVRIRGSSQVKATCNGGTNETVNLPAMSNISTVARPGTAQRDGDDSIATLTIVSITCGVVIVLLLITIVSLLVYFKLVYRSRKSSRNYRVNHLIDTDISYIRYDHVSVTHEDDTVIVPGHDETQETSKHANGYPRGGPQVRNVKGHNRNGNEENHCNIYNETDNFTRELEVDTLNMRNSYNSLDNYAYQRD